MQATLSVLVIYFLGQMIS